MPAERPRAVIMAIAGLDPSGGAGLSADVKAASALGAFCAPIIAAITVQDTKGVRSIVPVEPELLRAQAEVVIEDLRPKWAKIGVLYSAENIKVVASLAEEHDLKLVVDPVIWAGAGQPLLAQGALEALREHLLPAAFAITPNAREAGALSGVEVRDLESAKEAASALAELGPEVVVVKGGHLEGQRAVDVLFYKGRFHTFSRPRLGRDAHGSGCVFSSALAACLALGRGVVEAVKAAGDLAWSSIRWALSIGSGRPAAEPTVELLRKAERYEVLEDVRAAVELLASEPALVRFLPEVGTQIAMAISRPEGVKDVAAVEGRIVRAGGRPRPVGPIRFGASSHVARIILTAMKHDPGVRAAMNLRYDPSLLEALRDMGLLVASFDRSREPPEVAEREGATLPWGVEEAIKACGGRVPDVIYDLGGPGKEPMIRLLGRTAVEVARRALEAVRRARPS
ncbi:bifunctional hydroxymethylpyrimidine kinase/phosphomethylpyrimidine kinase [Candidatus Bathyarchaeota archaeon]|nr:MAG: bifunctional hydroxymethylpyrimidine kinase/phosphomethylpyrimidine kinase [Candidatus Bathyarchaeota archaeon]